jgi:hypothetical protein
MTKSAAQRIPVMMTFPAELARQDCWGRINELSAAGGILSTLVVLKRTEKVFLSFEIFGERFENIPGEVTDSDFDDDGYCRAEILWTDHLDRRRLARVLIDVLSRS